MMKFLIAITVEQYADEMHQLFQKHGVTAFHEVKSSCYNLPGKQGHRVDNWFSSSQVPANSIVNYVLVTPEQATALLEDFKTTNEKRDEMNAIKGIVLDAEQFV